MTTDSTRLIRREGVYERAIPGVSAEARAVDSSIDRAFRHYRETISSRRGEIEEEFARLAAEWKEATEFESSPRRIAAHPAYRRIVEMGTPVLPFILHDLEATHDDWFWALNEITGANPVPSEDRGIVPRMVSAWIRWGIRQNLI